MSENLHDLYAAIDRLNDEELDQVQAHINQRRMQPQIKEDPHTRAAALKAAFAEIREGLSQEDLDEMIKAMNADTPAKIAALHTAIEGFWDGISPEEVDEIVETMNSEYIPPLSDDEGIS